jgi:hypothetical protein
MLAGQEHDRTISRPVTSKIDGCLAPDICTKKTSRFNYLILAQIRLQAGRNLCGNLRIYRLAMLIGFCEA